MQVTYVSGPMRGFPKFNFPLFDGVRDALLHSGVQKVFNPADHDREVNPGCEQYPGFEQGDLQQYHQHCNQHFERLLVWDLGVIGEHCDSIVLLPGWENSTGAKIERFIAETYGLDIYLAEPSLDEQWGWKWYLDPEQKRLSLTFERLTETPWGEIAKQAGWTPPNAKATAQKRTQRLSRKAG